MKSTKPIFVEHRGYTATVYGGDHLKIQDWNGDTVASEVHWSGARGRVIANLKKAIDDYIRLSPFDWGPRKAFGMEATK